MVVRSCIEFQVAMLTTTLLSTRKEYKINWTMLAGFMRHVIVAMYGVTHMLMRIGFWKETDQPGGNKSSAPYFTII